MHISIRPELPTDLQEITTLNKLAFGQDNEALLVESLRESDNFIHDLSLVAIIKDEQSGSATIAGYIMFTKIVIINGDARYTTLALAPIAVHPAFQKQGIGAKLITTGLHKATVMGFHSVIVLGHEHYYPRFGFLPAARWGIRAPFDVPEEVFMAKELVPGGLNNISGTVEYPVAFSTM